MTLSVKAQGFSARVSQSIEFSLLFEFISGERLQGVGHGARNSE